MNIQENPHKKEMDRKKIHILIDRVRRGDQEAFSELVEQYTPLIDSLVSKFHNDEAVALNRDDLKQEAVLRFYNSILTFDTEQSEIEFGLYAKICVSNALISQFRLQKKRNAEQLTDTPAEMLFEDSTENPSDIIMEEERIKALYSVIRGNLSDYEYRIWRLYMSGRTAKSIGVAVGKDEKSVSNAIYRIRKKLRDLLG